MATTPTSTDATTPSGATSITQTTATLNGSVNPNGSISTVSFKYGTTTSYGSTVAANQSPITGDSFVSVNAFVGGLMPNTTYHYAIDVSNAGGEIVCPDMTFQTLPAAPDIAPPAPAVIPPTTPTGAAGNPAPAAVSSSGTSGFCGSETQISDHTCNSLHPAVTIDPYGTAGVVWQDTRNGTFDIYFKTVIHPLPTGSLLQGLQGTNDPVTGRSINVACSGFSAYASLASRCDSGAVPSTTGSNFVAQHSGGILDVNVASRIAVLSGTRGESFAAEGVRGGSQVRIDTGANAGLLFYVSRLLTNSVMELVYYDGIVSDAGFSYTIESNPSSQTPCEARLTCNGMTNTYPDIQADSMGRFHIVWQAGTNGDDDLYYVQIFPQDIGELKCQDQRSLTVGLGQEVPPSNSVLFDILTGSASMTFSYGSSSVADPAVSRGGSIPSRTGFHRLFRDFKTDNKWTGVSDVGDFELWQEQMDLIGSDIQPSYIAPAGHPLVEEGDFGSKFEFSSIAFLAESPQDGKIDITKIVLPLKPKCTPSTIPQLNAMREQDVVAAPKKIVPLTFSDPVDLSTIPNTVVDSMPPRFTIDGDTTVYTNVLIADAGGLSRLIFKKDPSNGLGIKFVLGQRSCGNDDCAVSIPSDGSNSDDSISQSQYKIRLDVFVGPPVSETDIATAMMTGTKIFSDEFSFSPGEDRRTFVIDSGRVIVSPGRYLFFVASSEDEDTFFVDAVGGGNVIWSTTNALSTGTFYQYYTPFTVPPNAGLYANVYYEGAISLDSSAGTCSAPINGAFEVVGGVGGTGATISINTSNSIASQALNQEMVLCRDTIISQVSIPIEIPDSTVASLVASITSIDGKVSLCSSTITIPPLAVGQQNSVIFNFPNPPVIPAGHYLLSLEATPSGSATGTLSVPLITDVGANADGIASVSIETVDNGNVGSRIVEGVVGFVVECTVAPLSDGTASGTGTSIGAIPSTNYIVGDTLRLTTEGGSNPRLSKDKADNLWLVFHSDRTGNDEVYITKFFADCGQWASSAQGGNEYRLSNAGADGRSANFPNSVCDTHDEVNVVWQSNDTDDGSSEIFFSKSTGGGSAFNKPIRLTASSGDALMPDIALSNQVNGEERIMAVWHDSRFGEYEIMAAMFDGGIWSSSGQGHPDTRITSAPGDSMFPRALGDSKANVRVVWQDSRRGTDNPGIYMGTYVGANNSWNSSGQGGADILITPSGTRSSLFPDVAVDMANGVFIVWQDDRLALTNPDQHEEIFGSYCSRQDAVLVHYGPLNSPNMDSSVQTSVSLVSCDPTISGTSAVSNQNGLPSGITWTDNQNVCLKIKSPGATYYRIANESGSFSDWTPFVQVGSLDTTIVPWVLSPGNGTKTITVQTQTDTAIGFPTTVSVIYHVQAPAFTLGLFSDVSLLTPLPDMNGIPIATAMDVYVALSTNVPLSDFPTFDVVSKGRAVRNQRMSLVSAATSGTSGSSGASGVSGFPGIGASAFKGSFRVNKNDGLFYLDGPARIIPHGVDIYGNEF